MLRLRVLGPFHLSRDGQEIRISSAKQIGLLAYLACEAPNKHTRERLQDLLWPRSFDSQARQSLRQAVSKLRPVIGTDLLVFQGEDIELSQAGWTSDYGELLDLLQKRPPSAAASIVDLWRGDVLTGLTIREPSFQNWLEAKRAQVREVVVDALRDLSADNLRTGSLEHALAMARQGIELEPFRDDLRRLLMTSLARLNRRAEALRNFEEYKQTLVDELGACPEGETQALAESLRLIDREDDDLVMAKKSHTTFAAFNNYPRRKVHAPIDKPSIAVLPFDNMSVDPEQEYFVDGMAEDIITSLSKVPQLFVIARNSSFIYKGMAVKVQQVGEELGVQYLLEGGVRKAGNRVRITAQLIDCHTGGHLWAEKFDRDLTDVFAVQDEVTQNIVSSLALTLTPEEQGRIKHVSTDSLEAYDCFLRGRTLLHLRSREGVSQAKAMFVRAVGLDPAFSSAHSQSAACQLIDYVNRWREPADQSLMQAYECAQKAVALDETNPEAHANLGNVSLWKRQHKRAVLELERAIRLDPNYANAYVVFGWVLHFVGRPKEGIDSINWGVRLDPRFPDIYLHWLAQAHFQLGRYEEAAEFLKRRILRKPDTDISRILLAACYGHMGRTQDAQAKWAEALRLNPDYSLERRRQILPYKDPSDFDRIVEGLKKASLPA